MDYGSGIFLRKTEMKKKNYCFLINFISYNFKNLFVFIFVSFLLSACATINNPLASTPKNASNKIDSDLNKITQDLISGNLDEASQNINRLLVSQPENGQLHFLNGLDYHLQFVSGNPSKRDLAETGYLLALEFSPFDGKAARQLGYLYLELSRWRQAQARFSQAVKIDSTDVDALLALAIASYSTHDFGLALWASAEAVKFAPSSPKVLYMAAVIRSASGKLDEAKAILSLYKKTDSDPQNAAKLSSAIDRWDSQFKSNGYLLAVNTEDTAEPQPAKPQDEPPSPKKPTNLSETVVSPDWADCQQYLHPRNPAQENRNIVNMPIDQNNGTSSRPLNALPSPCKGLPLPRSVIFDAFLLGVADDEVNNNGLNLLDGLAVVLSGTLTNTYSSGSNTRVLTSSVSTPTGGLMYSLNMLNAGTTKSELLSRPTLIALDREPSYFFMGADLSVAISGSNGSAGNLVTIPVGTNLIVTPTFIDDDSMLITVNIGRSSFRPVSAGGTFLQQTQTTRATAQANVSMKFGETLILSGLNEKELNNFDSRVPLLGSIPGIQYLFGKSTDQKKNTSAIVMLTPRKPSPTNQLPALKEKEKLSLAEIRLKASKGGFVTTDNVETTILNLADSRMYLEARSGDIYAEDWRQPSQLNKIFLSLKKALYF
jgi:tetratricopeptide (TPR) repeat protein